MKRRVLFAFLICILIGLSSPAAVLADGIIIPPRCPESKCPPPPPCLQPGCPPPPRPMEQLVIRYHHVTVTIQDQLAVTHVDQVFFNPNSWPVEGTYIFPLPIDAVVRSFTLWVDGKPVQGEVLDAGQARQIYEETVRSLRDPALLEYEGRGAVKASVFPIQPQGERRIELEYTQALTAQNGLVRFVYPLNTEKFSAQPLQDVSIRVEVRDRQAIRAVYSPSHPVGLDRQDDHHLVAAYEAKDVRPDSDFTLYYSLGDSEAFHLFSYRNPADPSDPDGFFLLLLAPKPGESSVPVAKDVLLVLDRSGSMEGEKFQQAQVALRYILQKLKPDDRFYLESFSTGVESYASSLRPASEVPQALNWVDQLGAAGSTDINRALLEAVSAADVERPTYLIFLTDGLPTEGVQETQEILNNFAKAARPNIRLFSFGVGYDVDTVLLDSLSQEHHGQSTYVRPSESLDEVLSAFYERISTPVLTDLQLDFGGLSAYDLYPNPLPDLFSGGQVIVVGRYRSGAVGDVTLRGQVNSQTQTYRFAGQTFAEDSRGAAGNLDAIPRLWATRKIGYLMNQIRISGPDKETIQQIVKLSIRYGIVTPYTSYLVTEQAPLGTEQQNKAAEEAFGQAQAAPMESSGRAAVDRAAQEGQMQSADVAPQPQQGSSEQQGSTIRVVGPRTFLYQGDRWVDTRYDPQSAAVQQVPFLSPDYFRLLAARPDLASALALGDQVTVVVDGQVFAIVKEGVSTAPLVPPPAVPTEQIAWTETPLALNTPQPTAAFSGTPEQPAPTITPAASGGLVGAPQNKTRPAACAAGFAPLVIVLAAALFLRIRK